MAVFQKKLPVVVAFDFLYTTEIASLFFLFLPAFSRGELCCEGCGEALLLGQR